MAGSLISSNVFSCGQNPPSPAHCCLLISIDGWSYVGPRLVSLPGCHFLATVTTQHPQPLKVSGKKFVGLRFLVDYY